MKYRLSTSEEEDGYVIVNGKPHGFKMKKQYEVTFKFDDRVDRELFIKQVIGMSRYKPTQEEQTE